jgi:hypothetical protein
VDYPDVPYSDLPDESTVMGWNVDLSECSHSDGDGDCCLPRSLCDHATPRADYSTEPPF